MLNDSMSTFEREADVIKLLFFLVPLGFCMWVLLFAAIFSIGHRAASHMPVIAMFHHGATQHDGVLIRVTDRL